MSIPLMFVIDLYLVNVERICRISMVPVTVYIQFLSEMNILLLFVNNAVFLYSHEFIE